jgi:hypothetical protein
MNRFLDNQFKDSSHFFPLPSFFLPHALHTDGSRKRIDFSSTTQPLRGKVFFLDLPRVKSEGLATLADKITQRGGIVEKCFHQKVRYLVTGRHKDEKKPADQSQAATLSPATPEGGVGVAKAAGAASRSPLESKAPEKSKAVAHNTRGAKFLAKSVSFSDRS